MHTEKTPSEDEVGHWGDTATSQSLPGAGRAAGLHSPSRPQKEQPAHTWTLDMWLPELGDNKVLLCKPPVCSTLLQQP